MIQYLKLLPDPVHIRLESNYLVSNRNMDRNKRCGWTHFRHLKFAQHAINKRVIAAWLLREYSLTHDKSKTYYMHMHLHS